MAFWIAMAVGLVLTVVGELLRPKPQVPNAKASALDEFEIPTADPNRNITVFVGKVLIKGSNVTWYGDLRTVALTQKVKTGMFSSTRQTYAHKYYLGLQHAIGFGDSSVQLHKVYFGDFENEPNHTRAVQADGSVLLTYNAPTFFGGDKEEGGLTGTMRFYPGSNTQGANAYMSSVLGEEFLEYHGLCHLIVEGMYLGTQKYIKPISCEVSRYPNGLGVAGGRHIIGEDCNPICFVYEVITNPIWGLSKTAANVDLDDFREVANIVYEEGYGMSMIYNGATSARDIIADVMRHIDGVMFADPSTGKLRIKLARQDYVKADLPVFDVSNISSAGIKFSRPSWSETTNTLQITYTSRAKRYTAEPYPVQELANIIQRNGETAPQSVDFNGFTTAAAVQKAGARALRTMSYPLAKLSFVTNRSAVSLLPGSVVRVSWPPLGIDDVVYRVTNYHRESITSNTIQLDLVEDIYALTDAAYGLPPLSDWVNPAGPPQALGRQAVIEAPYFFQESDASNLISFGSRSNELDLGYRVLLGGAPSALAPAATVEDFTSSAVLSAPYSSNTAADDTGGFTVSSLFGVDEINQSPTLGDRATGDTLVLLKSDTTEEFVAYGARTGLNYRSVLRGLLDTVVQSHPAGTQVWFIGSGFAQANQEPFGSGWPLTQYAKLLPYNALGELPADQASLIMTTVRNRAIRPYPPGLVRINGLEPRNVSTVVSGQFSLAWAHRNRVTQETMVSQNAPSVTPEEGLTYAIRMFKDSDGSLIFEKTGIGSSATSASATINFTGLMWVEITSSRAGQESYQPQRFRIDYTGTGPNAINADEAEYVLDGGGA